MCARWPAHHSMRCFLIAHSFVHGLWATVIGFVFTTFAFEKDKHIIQIWFRVYVCSLPSRGLSFLCAFFPPLSASLFESMVEHVVQCKPTYGRRLITYTSHTIYNVQNNLFAFLFCRCPVGPNSTRVGRWREKGRIYEYVLRCEETTDK